VCLGADRTSYSRYSPFALNIRCSPFAIRQIEEKSRQPGPTVYQLSAISQNSKAATCPLAKSQRPTAKSGTQVPSFQDFACKSHGLKILPSIPETEPLFSRFCAVLGEGGTAAIRSSPNRRRRLPATSFESLFAIRSSRSRSGGSPRIHAGEERLFMRRALALAGAKALDPRKTHFPSDKSEGFHPKKPLFAVRSSPESNAPDFSGEKRRAKSEKRTRTDPSVAGATSG
jgi:hypothetical protein